MNVDTNGIALTGRRANGIREINTVAIVNLVRRARRTTRPELISASGLSKATVSGIVRQLLSTGFIKESGTIQEGLGRSRVVLEFNPMARSVLGAQLDDDECSMVITDLDGTIYQRARRPLLGIDVETIMNVVIDLAEELRAQATSPVIGLGIGVPGLVDRTGRCISRAVSHGWKNFMIADMLEDRAQLPIMVANRAKVAALGEALQREHDSETDLVYIYLGTGIIAGIVTNGTLYAGRHGAAGDIGHVTVVPDGALCGCGNYGCLHAVAAEEAILGRARANARKAGPTSLLYAVTDGRLADLTLTMLAEAAHRHDEAALRTLDEVSKYIGLAVANLVNTLDPDVVVLGGPVARLGDPLVATIRQEVHRRSTAEAASGLEIAVSLSDETGAVGAAALWTTRAFSGASPVSTFWDSTTNDDADTAADGAALLRT